MLITIQDKEILRIILITVSVVISTIIGISISKDYFWDFRYDWRDLKRIDIIYGLIGIVGILANMIIFCIFYILFGIIICLSKMLERLSKICLVKTLNTWFNKPLINKKK